MAKSFNNLRVGKKFTLLNFLETFEFEVIEIFENGDCRLKDINTLEYYNLFSLIQYGKGDDFDIDELNI
ncbi:hypothetical protein EV198_1836 [Roseivirga ehrenbergii]|uniref:Uncharacterized protein n=1 Tax=Roseivirga ehrenbergii (strain DSM 102268 / JCM 13514 / KCTC 12282 / NCIMB 14502 / KMM 6017) TaxID=279360 RepID=A0A150XSQ5_ROSEK|nr:hypothetical protein [Roseivirga ehrenbergii]KYG81632.1 hypothetical protein MB14_13700 [Roseivirga ehrenbergii]TCL10804.1 hypothetical protein EV198_1836 [Roseivirga ehrenbergii]